MKANIDLVACSFDERRHDRVVFGRVDRSVNKPCDRRKFMVSVRRVTSRTQLGCRNSIAIEAPGSRSGRLARQSKFAGFAMKYGGNWKATIPHQVLVEREDGGEVEAVETLHCRELRLLDPALDGPPFPVAHLQLGQALQVTRVVGPFGDPLTGQLIVLPQK